MKLVDTHCHLNFQPMADDIDGVLVRATESSITHIIAPAYDLESWKHIETLSQAKPVHGAYGLHPWVSDQKIVYSELEKHLRTNKAVAVGEIGLDFKIDSPSRERQVEVFTAQLEIAESLGLPVLLHCRGAFEELIKILGSRSPGVRGVVHAYSRGPELARRLVGLGLHLAFGGAVTRKRADRARKSASIVPLDRLLLETDAPAIGLDGVLPHDVEPRHVREIGRAVAQIRGVGEEKIAKNTTNNACLLFRFD